MKIGDGNSSSARDNLLERMQRANRRERTEATNSVDHPSSASEVSGPDGVADVAPAGETSESRALASRLQNIAGEALDGKFNRTSDLRDAVIDAIIDERYADKIPASHTTRVADTLHATLSDDPAFRREVDQMLVHASRQLAHVGR